MLGINKRLDKIEYRLARIDKMLEDQQTTLMALVEYTLTVPKQVPSVVVHKPVSESRQRKPDWYPESLAKFMLTRYRTIDDAMAKFGYTKESVRTYIKNMRKAGLPIKTRGRAPTQYKIDNPHKGAKPNG